MIKRYHSICYLLFSASQSCLTLCHPTDCSPPGSSVHGIFQARILERAATARSRVKPTSLASPALGGGFLTTVPPEKHCVPVYSYVSPGLGTDTFGHTWFWIFLWLCSHLVFNISMVNISLKQSIPHAANKSTPISLGNWILPNNYTLITNLILIFSKYIH